MFLFSFVVTTPARSKRKSVSASAVSQRTPLTRSRSQSTSVKVIDHVFSPVAKQSKDETTKEEAEPRRSKRYSVSATRKSYKF